MPEHELSDREMSENELKPCRTIKEAADAWNRRAGDEQWK